MEVEEANDSNDCNKEELQLQELVQLPLTELKARNTAKEELVRKQWNIGWIKFPIVLAIHHWVVVM